MSASKMTSAAFFSPRSLEFFRKLGRNNSKAWFQAHRDLYERDVREPFRQLLLALQPPLAEITPHFTADPAGVGGSLYRIHRDVRYSHDKSPYKLWQGCRLRHVRHRQVQAPAFYLHLQPGGSFIGAGIWHPEPPLLRHLRDFIHENPGSWQSAAHAKTLAGRFDLYQEEKLVRPPRGYAPDFVWIEDLKLHNLVLWRRLDDATMIGPGLLELIVDDLHTLAPFVDYLCAALDLDF